MFPSMHRKQNCVNFLSHLKLEPTNTGTVVRDAKAQGQETRSASHGHDIDVMHTQISVSTHLADLCVTRKSVGVLKHGSGGWRAGGSNLYHSPPLGETCTLGVDQTN